MRLLVNCERLLTHVAVEAARSGASLAPSAPGPPVAKPSAGSAAWAGMGGHTPIDEARAEELETLIRTLVVGEAAELCAVLAVDAVGWSPSGSFTRRDEAVALIQQPVSSLAVDAFRVETLCWCEPLVFAGWSLQARQVNALLFNEDFLLEATGRTVELGGTTIARVEADRVARTFTHFDDADLIEQVILGH
ncbi:MAG: hypothetical protein ACXWBN_17885 [Acidimicrobiales bacterium]